jgi:Domain of unknown function (DUF4936)
LNYYVYYKVAPAQVATLKSQVEALFDVVEKQFGVRGRWMHRRDDPTTYMEVYEGVNDERGFEALLERESRTFGVARKVERFVCA